MSINKTKFNNLIFKINSLKSEYFAVIFVIIGIVIFFSGLNGGFQGDDNLQIVENAAVHSIGNIGSFFGSSTFWNGEALVGAFYRPMMTTTFAIIYSFFGANPMAFHVVQLMLYIACVYVLFLFLKTFFKPIVAFLVALLFLAHPINSQVVYAIPSMQEPLFFLFGMLALLRLSKSQDKKSLIVSSAYLSLSLLSKETGVVFVVLSVLYLFMFKKEHAVRFMKIVSVPVLIYLMMRANAVGLFQGSLHAAPISHLNFLERIFTIPSIILFYILKIIMPVDLATSYYWVYPKFDLEKFLLPLFAVVILAFGLLLVAKKIKAENKKDYKVGLFFLGWAVFGILPYMQIIALDMTACEAWAFCALPGLLGLLAIIISRLVNGKYLKFVGLIVILVIVAFGIRTFVRGFDYKDQLTLATKDISVSENNYLAMNNLAQSLIHENKLGEAKKMAENSIAIYPAVTNYTNLGVIKQKQGDFDGAKSAYTKALKYGNMGIIYENIAIVNFVISEPKDNIKFLHDALKVYPRNYKLWTYLAIQEIAVGSRAEAKKALQSAMTYGVVPKALYYCILNGQPLDIPIPGTKKIIHIP